MVEKVDFIEKAVAIVIVLFILSLIAERFITWFKLYFFKPGITFLGLFNWPEDYSKKSDDPAFEKERERRILFLNIILSVLVALLAHADIFKILHNDDPYLTLGWSANTWTGDTPLITKLKAILGCMFGGLFISLGSKFWHDTLDMLLYTKNLREKLGQKETYEVAKVEQLDEWLQITTSEIVRKVYEDNLAILKNFKNVISTGISTDVNGDDCIEVMIDDNDSNSIPKFFSYLMPNNKTFQIPVCVVQSSEIFAQNVQINLTEKVSHPNATANYGSFAAVVAFNDDVLKTPMLLTCFHVLKHPAENYNYFNATLDHTVSYNGSTSTIIGDTLTGMRDTEVDVALMKPRSNTVLINNIPGIGKLNGIRRVISNDARNKLPIYMQGATTKNGVKGIVKSTSTRVTLTYADSASPTGKSKWDLYNLIAVCDANGKGLSKGGDSGAPVIDLQNNLIGIVVGGSNERTYVIPIHNILYKLNINII